jgi:cell division protein FtsW (lipid II flippase)
MTSRRTRALEALLLVLAWIVGSAAYLLVDLGATGSVGSGTRGILLITAGIVVGLELTMRTLARHADPVLLPTIVAINLIGLAMIHRLDLSVARSAVDSGSAIPRADLGAQLLWVGVGLALFIGVLLVIRDHRRLQRYTFTAGLAGIVLLLLPLIPVLGKTINGANLWINIGPLSFQPAEATKILLVIFFAGYLVRARHQLALIRTRVLGIPLPRMRDLGPILLVWAASLVVLIGQRDLGTSLLLFTIFVVMLYVATGRWNWLVIGGLLMSAGAFLGYVGFHHVRVRFDIWLHPFADPANTGYQLVQSLYGLASGGLFGSGLGQGHPGLVPFAKSDFIGAALGEELGLFGLTAILMLYAIAVQRGLRIATVVRDDFGRLMAFGFAFVLAFQTFLVLGGVTRLIPLTGLTTPFLSYGGSSLVMNWVMVALLLRTSDDARRPMPVIEQSDNAMTQVIQR